MAGTRVEVIDRSGDTDCPVLLPSPRARGRGRGAAAAVHDRRSRVDSLADRPALVLSPCRDVLAATPLATAVCPGFAAGQNILRYIFLDPSSRSVYINWSEVAVEAVRTLRAAADPATRDDRQRRLVHELTAGSREFAALWARHEVREKTIGGNASATPWSVRSPSLTPRS